MSLTTAVLVVSTRRSKSTLGLITSTKHKTVSEALLQVHTLEVVTLFFSAHQIGNKPLAKYFHIQPPLASLAILFFVIEDHSLVEFVRFSTRPQFKSFTECPYIEVKKSTTRKNTGI